MSAQASCQLAAEPLHRRTEGRQAIGIALLYVAAFLVICTIAVAVVIQVIKGSRPWWWGLFAAAKITIAVVLLGRGFQTGAALLSAR